MSTVTDKLRAAPAETPAAPVRHEDDLYGWVEQQVALLRAGRLSDVDVENVAEELSDVGSAEYRRLKSALRLVLLHLLKWDHQPTHRSKSWVFSIRIQRHQIAEVLEDNPRLRAHLAEAIAKAYRHARVGAQQETGLSENVFEQTCPYDWSAITTRFVEHDDVRSPDED